MKGREERELKAFTYPTEQCPLSHTLQTDTLDICTVMCYNILAFLSYPLSDILIFLSCRVKRRSVRVRRGLTKLPSSLSLTAPVFWQGFPDKSPFLPSFLLLQLLQACPDRQLRLPWPEVPEEEREQVILMKRYAHFDAIIELATSQ